MSQENPYCSSSSSRHFGNNINPGGGGEKATAVPFEGRSSSKDTTTMTQKASTPDYYAIAAQIYRNMGIEVSPDDPHRRKKDKGKLVSKKTASNPLSTGKAMANAVAGNSSEKNPITKNQKASSSQAPDYYGMAAKFSRDLGIEVSRADPHLLKKDKGKLASMEPTSALSRKRQLECSAEKDDDHQRKKMKEPAAENNACGAENPRNEDKDDDERTILFAILGCYSKTGKYPFSDLIVFHHCIKNALRTKVSVSQLMYKIEGLLGKYNNNIVGEHGMEVKLLNRLNAYDQEVSEVSKRISGYGAEKEREGLIQGKQQLEEEKRRRKEEVEVCLKRLNWVQERIKPVADALNLIEPIVGARIARNKKVGGVEE